MTTACDFCGDFDGHHKHDCEAPLDYRLSRDFDTAAEAAERLAERPHGDDHQPTWAEHLADLRSDLARDRLAFIAALFEAAGFEAGDWHAERSDFSDTDLFAAPIAELVAELVAARRMSDSD